MGPSYYLAFNTADATASNLPSTTPVTGSTGSHTAWLPTGGEAASPLSIPLKQLEGDEFTAAWALAAQAATQSEAAQAEAQSAASQSNAAQAATQSSGSVLSPMGLRVRADEASASGQRAWQGTIYIPENLSKAKRTKLTFPATVTAAAGGEYPQTYSLTLGSAPLAGSTGSSDTSASGTGSGDTSASGEYTLQRSNMYDIVAKATKLGGFDITFSVQPWTPTTLTYDLHGPYYLEVEKTHDVEVKSGSTTSFSYSTNASELKFRSPKADPTNLVGNALSNDSKLDDLYTIEYTEDKILVSINTKVKVSTLTAINNLGDDAKENFKWIEIQAGNIHKKIGIHPLTLTPILAVDPDEITINAREQVSSGIYAGRFEIIVKTNCPKYKIEADSWNQTGFSTNGSTLLYVADEAGNRVTFGELRNTPESGRETLYLYYSGINDGQNFWTASSHTLGLNFSAYDEGGNAMPEAGEDSVEINTKPNTDNYIIHFKASGWSNPHIYVYQCLEFPAWYSYDNYTYAGKPIGYQGSGNDSGNYYAALEYSFTGNISFVGWDNKYPKDALNNWSTSSTHKSASGFWLLGTGGDGSWKATDDTNKYHYDLEYDFMANHRPKAHCTNCKNKEIFREWPGIGMEDEGNGWWKLTLPGVATPGKALIMFADDHSSDASTRYPAHAAVGIPLFDYPDREGWFEYDGTSGAFVSENPNANAATIYVFDTDGYNEAELKLNGYAMNYTYVNGLPCYVGTVSYQSTSLKFTGKYTDEKPVSLSKNGKYYYNNTNWNTGSLSLPDVASDKNRIFLWTTKSEPFVHLWTGSTLLHQWTDGKQSDNEMKYFYGKLYYLDIDSNWANVIFRSGSEQHSSDGWSPSNKKYYWK